MEAAAALIQAGMAVHVVAREQLPLVRALGPRLGQRLRTLHESHGVAFHGERALTSIRERSVTVDDGSTLDADLVILATGVRPNTEVAAAAGLALDQGILVDRYLETSVPGIYAAGDAARWPDPNTGVPVRFEHWATAERQGQTAARNMLGALEAFETIPFFWTQQYDVRINYVGYASWDRIEVRDGLPPDQWEQHHSLAGKQVGLATIGRDSKSLSAELALEHGLRTSRPAPVRPVRPRANAGSLT
jgi:NADPH-dependent 2,4-dienoyl-CoA reductase/sulfur reductase-like enzyme